MISPTATTALLLESALLGAGNYGAAGRSQHGSDGGTLLIWLLVPAVGIAVVCVVVNYASRWLHQWRYHSHASLFLDLCQVHGLDFKTRRLLRQIARHHHLKQIGRVFTEPKWLDPARLSQALRARGAEIRPLRVRLFAE